MSLCLIKILKEWIGILFVAFSSLFINDHKTENITVAYNINNFDTNMTVSTIDYKTDKIYNDKLPSETINILTEGEPGIVYTIDGEEILFREPVDESIEIGTGPKESYVGSITGYGADCIGCSGNVSCKTPDGVYNLKQNGEYYNDLEYGSLRIVAADNSLFKCGTVLDIETTNGNKIHAIVLDTGISLRNAWRNQKNIVVDVAFKSEDSSGIYEITDRSGKVKFDVKRWGW